MEDQTMEVHGYTENGSIEATIDGVRWIVPDDPSNRHRQMIAEWEAEGNTIPPYEPPVLTPEEKREAMPPLTRRQLRLGLLQNGISTTTVEAAIDAIPDEVEREAAKIEWEDASQYLRTHPLIEQIGVSIGLTPEQIDAMWEAASEL